MPQMRILELSDKKDARKPKVAFEWRDLVGRESKNREAAFTHYSLRMLPYAPIGFLVAGYFLGGAMAQFAHHFDPSSVWDWAQIVFIAPFVAFPFLVGMRGVKE